MLLFLYFILSTHRVDDLAESNENEKASVALIDVANEEREHVGEFMRLLKELTTDEEKFYQKGQQEVEEIFEQMKQ